MKKFIVPFTIATTLAVFLFYAAMAEDYDIPITVNGETYTITVSVDGTLLSASSVMTNVVIGDAKVLEMAEDSTPKHIEAGSYIVGVDIDANSRWQLDRVDDQTACGFAIYDDSKNQIDFGIGGGNVIRLDTDGAYELTLLGCGAIQIVEDGKTKAEPSPIKSQPQANEKITYEQICDGDDGMTSVQQSKFAKSFEGKRIYGWKGMVYDVYERRGNFIIEVEMEPDAFLNARDIVIDGVDQEFAESVSYEQMIEFNATIKSVDIFWGTICNPINMYDPEIKVSE